MKTGQFVFSAFVIGAVITCLVMILNQVLTNVHTGMPWIKILLGGVTCVVGAFIGRWLDNF